MNPTDELMAYADIVQGQEAMDRCTCGEVVTRIDGSWVHVYNPELTGADHDVNPSGEFVKIEDDLLGDTRPTPC